ncbi:hypothetical protein AtubIFM61612_010908 [Aspergillus tubingensis]|nr:hypothetical protein AtubIFM61612_010908 [Aspergillus tubingensis]
MVGNVPSWKASDWRYNIKLAADAHIDASALNMAHGWYANEETCVASKALHPSTRGIPSPVLLPMHIK